MPSFSLVIRRLKPRLLASAFFALGLSNASAETSPCREQSSVRALIRAYVLSTPLFESRFFRPSETVRDFVTQRKSLFKTGGASTECAAFLASRLLRAGINIHDPNAYERAVQAGPSEFAQKVAEDLNRPATELVSMAIELAWLAVVLPDLANGDPTVYETTGPPWRLVVRKNIPQVDSILALADGPRMIAEFKRQIGDIESVAQQSVLAIVAALSP